MDDEQLIITTVVAACMVAAALYNELYLSSEPYHTGILGELWVQDLIQGNPQHFCDVLGINKHTFFLLLQVLVITSNISDSRCVSAEEQLAIFLYAGQTNLSARQLAERFQHSTDTISRLDKHDICRTELTEYHRHIHQVSGAITSPSFVEIYMHLPTATTPLSDVIRNNPKFIPYFQDAVGAVDCTHIHCWPTNTT
jgi:hypothetical protein